MKAILYDRKRKAERGSSGQPDLMLPVTPTKTTPTNRRTPAIASSEPGHEIISVYRQVTFFKHLMKPKDSLLPPWKICFLNSCYVSLSYSQILQRKLSLL